MRNLARSAAVLAAATLVLTGCGRGGDDGDDTSSAPETAEAVEVEFEALDRPDFKACMVSDSGGFDDKSFNQTARAGLTGAVKDYKIQESAVQSAADADYAPNLKALVGQKCQQISTVGFLLGDATLASAKANPNVFYSIVDFSYLDETGKNVAPANLKGLTFDTAAPSFMAGYLAASQSESGIVGTLGGAKLPTVTIFMDGFWEGVQYYNEEKDADVKVVGWDETTQNGSFTDDFENQSKAQTAANALIQQGADVILPVAGPAGQGALKAAKDADAKAIWVDTDGCTSVPEYCDILLTSVVKGMDDAVQLSIQDVLTEKWSNEPYVGTLDNGGVGIAPYNEFDSVIDDDTKTEIDEIRFKLIEGEIEIKSEAVPKN